MHVEFSSIEEMEAATLARAKEQEKHLKPSEESRSPLQEHEIRACERENYSGDGKIYSYLHRGKFVYVRLWQQWLYWKGHNWELDIDDFHALRAVENVALEYLRVAAIIKKELDKADLSKDEKGVLEAQLKGMLARASRCRSLHRRTVLDFARTGQDSISIVGNELDADPWLLGVANGVIDLRDGTFRAGHPEDYITMVTNVNWEGYDADAEPFLAFLRNMLDDNEELVQYLIRFLGMSLFAGQREHCFLVLYGEGGRNGKDTLMSILGDVLGEDMCSPVKPELFMEQSFVTDPSKPSPHLMDLRGKRIVYASESSKKHRFNSEVIKRLTGGGKLEARGLLENYMSKWEMTHTIILLTNELPAAPPDDAPFWDRVHGIELKRRFVDNPKAPNESKKDPDLRRKVSKCGSGILALLVKGFADYLHNGLNPPPEVTLFREGYRKAEDLVGSFIEDCCDVHEEKELVQNRTGAKDLFTCFQWWWNENIKQGTKLSVAKFSADMQKRGFERRKISSYFYMGITINQDTRDAMAQGTD